MGSVRQLSGRPGFHPRSGHTKDLKKCYLIPPCLTVSIIRYISRVKWSNPGKGVAPSPTPRCFCYWKGSLRVALDYSCQLYYLYCHPQTVCFVVSQLFSVARRLKLGSKPTRLYVRSLSQQVNHVSWGIIRHWIVAFVCLHLYLTG